MSYSRLSRSPCFRVICVALAALVLALSGWAQDEANPVVAESSRPPAPTEAAPLDPTAPVRVFVIPIRDQIAPPSLFVLRRGLKTAIDEGAQLVLLDMDTPGGRADVMLEMMEALDRFGAATATFVNDEAGSAGALIAAVTDDIYFAPKGVMGAAEMIQGTGADVPAALKRKMDSYLGAKIRAFADTDPRRADVLKAMMNADFELKVGEEVLKRPGELLTLTAAEATRMLGDPPRPLLATGIAESVEQLLQQRYPDRGITVTRMELTWSEHVAQWLTKLAPVLLGVGLLGLFIEFKTPGFGIFGIGGIILLLTVFLGHYIAGLSGHEPALFFGLGLVLLALEVFLVPGTVLLGLLGVVVMLGSLVWGMADLWPNEPISWSGELFARPLANLAYGIGVSVVSALLLLRFLPRGWFWDRMILANAIGGTAPEALSPEAPHRAGASALLGREGVAVSVLSPSGEIEIDGRRYEARLEVGFAEVGARVVVRAHRDFGLIVERTDTA